MSVEKIYVDAFEKKMGDNKSVLGTVALVVVGILICAFIFFAVARRGNRPPSKAYYLTMGTGLNHSHSQPFAISQTPLQAPSMGSRPKTWNEGSSKAYQIQMTGAGGVPIPADDKDQAFGEWRLGYKPSEHAYEGAKRYQIIDVATALENAAKKNTEAHKNMITQNLKKNGGAYVENPVYSPVQMNDVIANSISRFRF